MRYVSGIPRRQPYLVAKTGGLDDLSQRLQADVSHEREFKHTNAGLGGCEKPGRATRSATD